MERLCDSMELKLLNPYFIKLLPGRMSDVKDAQWIAECLLKNLILPHKQVHNQLGEVSV